MSSQIPSRSYSSRIRTVGCPIAGTRSRLTLNARFEFGDEKFVKLAALRRSRVAFDLEPMDDLVKRSVVHHDFEPGSLAAMMVQGGWPIFLSSLKSLLETGEPLSSTRR